ncbi:NIPSNAP family protein, partial [Escherichia coli]|nr:NIPSNAP family protein [Escherichia coli]
MPESEQPKAVRRTAAAGRHFSSIVELRRYTLHPGRRDDLIDLFDTHFLESQEACGMTVIGQFRDPDDPD